MTTTETQFAIPTRAEVSENNQAIFDSLDKSVGFVPNLYAFYGKNETALGDYLAFDGRKSGLKAKEKEVINLVTSQLNGCRYCQSAHTAIGKMNGFDDEQIVELRKGTASFDAKLDALVKFTASLVTNNGKADNAATNAFFNAGYSEAQMIDVVLAIASKTASNYLHNLTQFDIDFPIAQEL